MQISTRAGLRLYGLCGLVHCIMHTYDLSKLIQVMIVVWKSLLEIWTGCYFINCNSSCFLSYFRKFTSLMVGLLAYEFIFQSINYPPPHPPQRECSTRPWGELMLPGKKVQSLDSHGTHQRGIFFSVLICISSLMLCVIFWFVYFMLHENFIFCVPK